MPTPRRTTVLLYLTFAVVLCLAVIFRPKNVALLQVKTSANFREDYVDIIGIDLGRTYSRAGIFRNGTFEIIVDEQGRSVVPSYVAFTNQGLHLVGFAAKEQAVSNPKNTVYDVRRLIGREFPDPELQNDIKDLTYDVVEDNGRPSIKIRINGTDRYFTPEEISSKILENLKNMTETQLNRRVTCVVITVPSYFNDAQRYATKDAAMMAGLTVLRVVNEAAAAGIAYGIDLPRHNKTPDECDECIFIIYNLGAKESDLALESIAQGIFEILALAGDRNLGGDDFENSLLSYATTRFNKKNSIDITKNPEVMNIFKSEVDRAVQVLSTELSAQIEIPSSRGYNRFSMTITQTQLQKLNKKLSDRSLNLLKQLLKNAKMERREVNGIIFTGDPTHIAKIQPFLEAYLDGKKALCSDDVSSDQAIVRGAAIQGDILLSHPFNDLTEVTRLSLGIETNGGIFTKLIPGGTLIPTCKTYVISTTTDNQERVLIKVLEGERAIATRNRLLGTVELTGLLRKPKGEPEIEVVFEMDMNEILTVLVRERESGNEEKLIITGNKDRYTQEEIETILDEAESHYKQDKSLLKERVIEGYDGKEEWRFGVIAK